MLLPAVNLLISKAKNIHLNGRDAFIIEAEDLSELEQVKAEYEESLKEEIEIKYEQEQTNRS